MSDIQRLLRVAARRNESSEYGSLRIRLLKEQMSVMRAQLKEDGISANVLIEAVVRGYIDRHPAVLAMLDQWRRDEQPESVRPAKTLNDSEIADIYAILGSGIMEE